MAKSIPALVTPSVLQWARNLDQITPEEIAKKLKVDIATITAWENGTETPTLVQAKKLAKQYRIPFAYLYLPDTPQRTKRLDKVDYRTFGNWGDVDMSRELRWFLRDIEERRDAMIDLYASSDLIPQPFTFQLSHGIPDETFATELRSFIGLTNDEQIKFRKPEVALSFCIAKLEQKDFLVFQAAQIRPEEMRGLSVAYDTLPIIALNRKDEPSARLFTLIHELVHLVTKTSGICNDMSQSENQQYAIELFCNRIAGLTLVPTAVLKHNKRITQIKTYGLDDSYISAIARDFAVSKDVILHRLCDIGIISKRICFETQKRYNEEYRASKSKKTSDGFIPPALDKGTQVGKLYAKTVLSAYHADKLTAREASNHLLGLGLSHFNAIERWCY